jgi:hypothetical protein
MITRSKQNWGIGNTVKVGFMSLKILDCKKEYDYLPDIYILVNEKTGDKYEFIPHNGLSKILSS